MKTRLEEILERTIRELEAEERRVALDIEDLRQALEKINQEGGSLHATVPFCEEKLSR